MVSVGLALAVGSLQVPSVGRFVRSELPQPMGFVLDRTGFAVSGVPGPKVYFPRPLARPHLVEASPTLAWWAIRPRRWTPSIIEVALTSPGFALTYERGFGLLFKTEDSPLLTSAEVTVDAANPTPPTTWVLVSFTDPQVPILLVFEKPVTLTLKKGPDGWGLTTEGQYNGEVKVRLPLGAMRLKSEVADLGAVVALVQAQRHLWASAPPMLKGVTFASADGGVRVTWKYDRPSALVPPYLLLQDPGSGVRVESPVTATVADVDLGPQQFCKQDELTVFLPARWLLSSQPLSSGAEPLEVRTYRAPGLPTRLDGDYLDGLLPAADPSTQVRLTSAAVAPSLYTSNPDELGRAALLSAGLAALSRLPEFRAERGIEGPAAPPDAQAGLRQAVFGAPGSALEQLARSPVRVNGVGSLTCREEGDAYWVGWRPSAPGGVLSLAAPWPLDVADAKGVAKISPKPGREWFTLEIQPSGQAAEVRLRLPARVRLPSRPG